MHKSQIKLQKYEKKNTIKRLCWTADTQESINGKKGRWKRTSGQNVITINKSVNDSLSFFFSPSLSLYHSAWIYIIHLGTFVSYFKGMTWCDPKITPIMTMHWLQNWSTSFISLFFFFFFFLFLLSFASKNITLHLQVLIHYLFIH